MANKQDDSGDKPRNRVYDHDKLSDPRSVLESLKAGRLSNLAAYLERHRSIPDEKIAKHLLLMIVGPATRVDFRLEVINHPDGATAKGGRPEGANKPSRRDTEIAAEIAKERAAGDREKTAVGKVAEARDLSDTTVRGAAKRVKVWQEKEAVRKRHEAAEEARLEEFLKLYNRS